MKRLIKRSFILVFVFTTLNLSAQKENLPKLLFPYLGNSNYSEGFIPKRAFDSLLKQRITARDSNGNSYKVTGFTFSYGERNLYEDSIGNLMMLTDYFSEYCVGDTITPAIRYMLNDNRTKAGDTAYIESIKVILSEGRTLRTKGMKFILTK